MHWQVFSGAGPLLFDLSEEDLAREQAEVAQEWFDKSEQQSENLDLTLDLLNLRLLRLYLDATALHETEAQARKDALLRLAEDDLGKNHHRTRRLKKQLARVPSKVA